MSTQAYAEKPLISLSHQRAPSGKAAPFLPMSRAEMTALGWDACDIVLVTGDAYVDHPSFGMAIIGRLLEAQGFRVGIIAQPDWQSAEPFKALGKPTLFFGVTGGNMDSMVNRYTADRRLRHDDAYTPGGEGGRRPDRCTIVYAQRCREAFKDVPIVLGGIEASLRRIAHYDYWSEKVRRSILADAKADLLLYGNAERAVVEVANRLAAGEAPRDLDFIRGVALFRRVPDGYTELHADDLDSADEGAARHPGDTVIRLPAYEQVEQDREAYARASRVLHRESNPGNARPLVQRHGDRDLWLNPPPIPLTSAEMDAVYDLPYARAPHPSYGDAKIPAWDMIKFSVTIMRGCFGGCTFCSITEHEGRIIQNRSEGSILREIERIRDKTPGFTGVISDIGGPTANMYRMACKDPKIEAACRLPSCVFPDICPNLNTSHDDLIRLYRKVREVKGVKKVMVASGVRYDLAVKSPEYVKELVDPSRRRLSEDRARAHRARPARQDDEAGDRRLRPLQADVRCRREAGRQEILPDSVFHRGASGHDRRGHDEPRALAQEEPLPRRPGADVPAVADGDRHGHVPYRRQSAARRAARGERQGRGDQGAAAAPAAQGVPALSRSRQLAAAARGAETDGPRRSDRLAPRPARAGPPAARHRQGRRHATARAPRRQDAALHHEGSSHEQMNWRSGRYN